MSNRSLILTVLLALLGGAFFIAGSSAAEETARYFYQWVDEDGVAAATDDVKRIPSKYREAAQKREFAEVGEHAAITEVTIPGADYQASLEASLERQRKVAARTVENPNRTEDCDGPVTVKQERHERVPANTSWTGSNTYNSMFFVVRDSCGNVKSITLQNPIPVVNLETNLK